MSTGIGTNAECMTMFNELKLQSKYGFVTFKITDDNTTVEPCETGASLKDNFDVTEAWEEFKKVLPKDDCRYGIFDFGFNSENGQRRKLLFVVWTPDTAKIKRKMVYAGTKDSLKKQFNGIQVEIQATDDHEIDYATVLERAARFEGGA